MTRRALFRGGLVMVAASPSGPFGVIKEMFAVGKTLADVKLHGASSDLVKTVVADLETAEARQQSMPAELQGETRRRRRRGRRACPPSSRGRRQTRCERRRLTPAGRRPPWCRGTQNPTKRWRSRSGFPRGG